MKPYSPNEKVPMKFHKLYVVFLNPLGILILAAIATLTLFTALNLQVLPEIQQRLGGRDEAAQIMIWILFGAYALAFLFALISEILLAKRRPMGVILLLLNYLLSVASAVYAAYRQPTGENLLTAALTGLIAILVCLYYWRRRRLFHRA